MTHRHASCVKKRSDRPMGGAIQSVQHDPPPGAIGRRGIRTLPFIRLENGSEADETVHQALLDLSSAHQGNDSGGRDAANHMTACLVNWSPRWSTMEGSEAPRHVAFRWCVISPVPDSAPSPAGAVAHCED
jgi:hypothetical protein